MVDSLVRFRVVDTNGSDGVDFDHCIIYDDYITVVDARYVVSHLYRGLYTQGLHAWGCKMLWLNNFSITKERLIDEMKDVILRANEGVMFPSVTVSDAWRICVDVFNTDRNGYQDMFSGNDIPTLNFFSERKSLAKKSITSVCSLSTDENTEFLRLMEVEGEYAANKYKKNISKYKKNKYIASCRQHTKNGIIDSEILTMLDNNETASEIRNVLLVNYDSKTVNEALKRHGLYVGGWGNSEKKEESEGKMIKAGDALHGQRVLINKYRIEKKTKEMSIPVSRPTVYKHWDALEDRFKELNDKLLTTEQ